VASGVDSELRFVPRHEKSKRVVVRQPYTLLRVLAPAPTPSELYRARPARLKFTD